MTSLEPLHWTIVLGFTRFRGESQYTEWAATNDVSLPLMHAIAGIYETD